jgi:hypothetical protein
MTPPQIDEDIRQREQDDHDLLIEIRTDLKHLVQNYEELKIGIYGDRGLCNRIQSLEGQQKQWQGRDGVVMAVIATVVSVATALGVHWATQG